MISFEYWASDHAWRRLAVILAAVVIALGAVELVAWISGKPGIVTIGDTVHGVAFTTASGMILCGISIVFSVFDWQRFRVLSGMLTLAPASLCVAKLVDVVGGFHWTLERRLTSVFVDPELLDRFADSMALNTTVALLSISLAQCYLAFVVKKQDEVVLLTAGLVTRCIALVALIGYGVGNVSAYQWGQYLPMSQAAAVGLWLLGEAQLLLAIQMKAGFRRDLSAARVFLTSLVCAVGLYFDLSTPIFVSSNIIYVPVVLAGLWFAESRVPAYFALACSLFSLLVFFAKIEPTAYAAQGIVDRGLGIASLFLVAGLIYVYKEADRRSKAGTLRFDALMDNATDAIVIVDEGGTITGANPAAVKMFGYSEPQLVGESPRMLLAAPELRERDEYAQALKRIRDDQAAPRNYELAAKRADGSEFPLDVSISVLPHDETPQYIFFIRDLTARKNQEEMLRQAHDRLAAYALDLERSNKELDDFAYIASHDLKEPLRGIHNHAGFLLEDYGASLDSEANRRLGRLIDLSRRMEKLVNDLLYFSRIGRQDLGIAPTDIRAVVGDVASSLENFLEERNTTLSVADSLPVVTCDSVGVTEIFRNLIVNAAKYNDQAERRVEVGFQATHADASGTARDRVFSVRDNGRGIATEFHEEIFKMFKRLERPEKGDTGTGAGLAFVRKIVERHGGHIWLQSEPGAGTTVFFTLSA